MSRELMQQLKESLGDNYIDLNKDSELHLMLDLETMGLAPDGAIISIGAVLFNIEGGEDNLLSVFYSAVNLSSSVSAGMTINPDTLLWWISEYQDAARLSWVKESKIDLAVALDKLSEMLKDYDLENLQVWGNGVDFDNVILSKAYELVGKPTPWGFRQNRCFRTLKNVFSYIPEPAFVGTRHNALHDAKHQAFWLAKILAKTERG